MRRAAAGMARLHVQARVSRLGRRRAVRYADGRAVVPIAEMGVERVVPGVAHRLRELRSQLASELPAFSRFVVDHGKGAPRRDALEILHRLGAGADARRTALGLVARKQMFASPALV